MFFINLLFMIDTIHCYMEIKLKVIAYALVAEISCLDSSNEITLYFPICI